MHMRLILCFVAFCTSLFAPTYNEHSLTADKESKALPDSEKLHEKIGKPGFYERTYATLSFTKKTPDEAFLKTVKLQWEGPPIRTHKIKGTLFKKLNEGRHPIHENHIASSTWDEHTQCLTFTLSSPFPLQGTTKFSIVLTVNKDIEKLLKKGSFSLITTSLPEAFQAAKKQGAQ